MEQLIVDFYEVKGGWLCFKLTVGQQTFDSRFSDVFDPLPDFKHWLEAIAIGVQQTSFQYDPEGNEIKFDFERVAWNREVLTISETFENGKVFINANINRRQIVKAFYLGLLNFASSDKFNPKEWEVEYLKERLCEILNIDEDTLIEQLIELDKKELGEILFKANPVYRISYPGAADKNEEWNRFIEDIFANDDEEVSNKYIRVETPVEWDIPDDYTFWPTDKKRQFVINCINEKTDSFEGMKINDFRSAIIEKFLDEE